MKSLSKLSLLVVMLFGVIGTGRVFAPGFELPRVETGHEFSESGSRRRQRIEHAQKQKAASRQEETEHLAAQQRNRQAATNRVRLPEEQGGFFSMGKNSSFENSSPKSSAQNIDLPDISLKVPGDDSPGQRDNKTTEQRRPSDVSDLPTEARDMPQTMGQDNRFAGGSDNRQAPVDQQSSMFADFEDRSERTSDSNVDNRQATEEQRRQAGETEEQLGDQFDENYERALTKNIQNRVEFKKWRKKWGVDTAEEIRARIDRYGDSYTDAITFKTPAEKEKFRKNLKLILSEGLESHAEGIVYASEILATPAMPFVTAGRAVGTRWQRNKQIEQLERKINNRSDLDEAGKKAQLDKEIKLMDQKGLLQKKYAPKGVKDALTVDTGRYDLRSNDRRIREGIDVMLKPPMSELEERLNLSPEQQVEFIKHTAKVADGLTYGDKFLDLTREKFLKKGIANYALLAATLTLAVVIVHDVLAKKGRGWVF